MSHYWKRCPHCGRTIEDGYGFPLKRLGDPRRKCIYCFNEYNDSSVIDWESASVFKKIRYYYANGRFFFCFIPYIIVTTRVGSNVEWADWQVYLACSPIFLIASLPCILYVRHQVKSYLFINRDDIEKDSPDRRYERYKEGLFGSHQPKSNKKNKR